MILIVAFAITKNGKTWQLNTKPRLSLTLLVLATVFIDEAAEVPSLLLCMDSIVSSLGTLGLHVDKCNIQGLGEPVQHAVRGVIVTLVEKRIQLHGNDAPEQFAGVP